MNTVLNTTQEIVTICSQSSYLQRDGNLNYYYVYVHINPLTNSIFYVGQGSHNRAYKYKGRSVEWYNRFWQHGVIVQIIESGLSFIESVSLEREYIERNRDYIINTEYGHSPTESFPVLCFTKRGKLVKRYNNSEETSIDGFSSRTVSVTCNPNQHRKTYKEFVWCYEKDYDARKDQLFVFENTCKKEVLIVFPDGTEKTYESINSTLVDGFLPAKVREVCIGTRKSHRGCKCTYITRL